MLEMIEGRLAYSYDGRLIASRILAFNWYQFWWPWMTLNDN